MDVSTIIDELENRLGHNGVDYLTLTESSSLIERVTSLILGIMINVILIVVPLIVALEVIYICFPIFRDGVGKLIVTLESKGVDNKVFDFVFRDAVTAINRSYVGELQSKSPLWIYLTIKVKSIVVVFFLVSLVVKGSPLLIDIAWNLLGELIKFIFY